MFQKDKKNNDTSKKILCYNTLNGEKCNYGTKCLYAHSLNEQKIEPLRHKVYTIIKSKDDLKNIDLINDQKLYDTLIQLTKVCTLCNKGICPGGYNCRNGSINIKTRICYEDLFYGNCKKINCTSVHLTTKGLIPYIKQKNKDKYLQTKTTSDSDSEEININDDIKDLNVYKYQKNIKYNRKQIDNLSYYDNKNIKVKKELDNISGILLTEKFLLLHFGRKNNNDLSSDSEKEEDVDKMIEFFNDNDSDSDESIFLV
jgi:hypothetical protein